MNQLQVFQNNEFGQVRILTIENEPWFVGKDVAKILGYSNTSKAVGVHVDDEDKAEFPIWDGSQNRNTYLINEGGLYSLILSSKLPNATMKKTKIEIRGIFTDWKEVKPEQAWEYVKMINILRININQYFKQERIV